MTIEKYRHPILFYGLSIVIPWVLWFIAAYISHIESSSHVYVIVESILGVIGLASPMIVAFILMFLDSDLRNDLLKRLFHFNAIKPFYIIVTCFLMIASILLAQAISLLFGYSPSQFSLAGKFSFSAGLFPAWFLLFVAPLLEELAWHSYGTDCLRKRFNLFTVSIIFAVFWAFWHFPLSFIKDYYQSNLVETGVIYSINFSLSLIPFVILMNWLYYKTGRNIIIPIVFHITAGFFNEVFATHPMSKVIQTVLLLILSIVIVIKERDFFFKLEYQEK
ncbi:CPBP family intramembrane metalloprotease [Bacillus sp. DX1.1]|uniref:CPBP family intramembrane glutamic endopeptidase n=1 Tax=unclassified Bacillus (in: firmicutes) TaxID=185979 RepID=UPI00257076EA|nr:MULTISPECIES: CPBP family intramembrane glutamic endopeptidase [unclassified Bacillus (in: firmicutes)]MDM5154256.1 CPBP family intramembrane metalloprotease [Bacillus sp. DX1.1]WJE83175.1 CPBP family intramembrane metalloprotease [Bacillus sp. DX3.1]